MQFINVNLLTLRKFIHFPFYFFFISRFVFILPIIFPWVPSFHSHINFLFPPFSQSTSSPDSFRYLIDIGRMSSFETLSIIILHSIFSSNLFPQRLFFVSYVHLRSIPQLHTSHMSLRVI